jgi:hypothetical protein
MRKLFLITLCAFVLIGIGLFRFHNWASRTFGVSYNPNNSRDLQKLSAIAKDSLPLRKALERFKQDHGNYPDNVTNLFFSYLKSTNGPNDFSDWAGWRYQPESTNSYSLFYHPNWDDGFWYECSNEIDSWHYSDGTENADLTEKLKSP